MKIGQGDLAVKMNGKLEFARWVVETVVPYVRRYGQHYPAGTDGPSHWRLKTPDLFFVLSDHALLASEDRSLSCVLDAWVAGGAKVLSITWEPNRPWTPPQVVRLANGPWREVLIRLQHSAGLVEHL